MADITLGSISSASSAQLPLQIPQKDSRIKKVTLEMLKAGPPQARLDNRKRTFTILFTGDTHSNLDPSDVPDDVKDFKSPIPLGGVLRRIKYIEHVRQIQGNPVIVLDAGDFLQGTLYFSRFQGVPELEFMRLAGYDILTVGNHDFDLGGSRLAELLKEGDPESICSNIYFQGKPWFTPYALREIEGQRVAFIGMMGKAAWQSISHLDRKGLELKDPGETLNEILPQLRHLVDVIILLSHSGIDEDRELAKQHPMVDIIIGGHSHTWMEKHELVTSSLNGREKRLPVFHSLCNGMLVGKMEVEFDEEGRFSTAFSSVQRLDEQFTSQPSEMSQTLSVATTHLQRYQAEIKSFAQEKIGMCQVELTYDGIRGKLMPLGQNLARSIQVQQSTDVGVIYSGTIRSGIKEGLLTRGGVYKVYGAEHELWIGKIKGSRLAALLRNNEMKWEKKSGTFQYAGITLIPEKIIVGDKELEDNAFYTLAGPSYFFQREFMNDKGTVKPEYANDISGTFDKKHQDIREAIVDFIKVYGLGPEIKGVNQT